MARHDISMHQFGEVIIKVIDNMLDPESMVSAVTSCEDNNGVIHITGSFGGRDIEIRTVGKYIAGVRIAVKYNGHTTEGDVSCGGIWHISNSIRKYLDMKDWKLVDQLSGILEGSSQCKNSTLDPIRSAVRFVLDNEETQDDIDFLIPDDEMKNIASAVNSGRLYDNTVSNPSTDDYTAFTAKFKPGDWVSYYNKRYVVKQILENDGDLYYWLDGHGELIHEDYLQPYTNPHFTYIEPKFKPLDVVDYFRDGKKYKSGVVKWSVLVGYNIYYKISEVPNLINEFNVRAVE